MFLFAIKSYYAYWNIININKHFLFIKGKIIHAEESRFILKNNGIRHGFKDFIMMQYDIPFALKIGLFVGM